MPLRLINIIQSSLILFIGLVASVSFSGCDDNGEKISKLAKIEISSSAGNQLDVNESVILVLKGFDESNMPFTITSPVNWSSSSDHASIDNTGKVTGVSVGTAIITASVNEVSGTLTLTIAEPVLSRIEINSPKNLLDLDESVTLTASGFDTKNKPFDISSILVWSVDNGNVSIDQTGTATGVAVGKSSIKAQAGPISKTFAMEVWDSNAPRLEVYVSDAGNFDQPPWKILKYDGNGGNPKTFISSNLAWPQDILFLEDQGIVLVSNLNTGNIAKFNSSTGAYLGDFATGISGPTRMKLGPDDNLYVLQWGGNGRVLRYKLDGTSLGSFTATGVFQSIGLVWDASGNLYVSSFNNGAAGFVTKFNTSGASLGTFISSSLQGPTNIWFDTGGNMLVLDWQAGRIQKFNASGGFVSTFTSGLSQVEGVDFLDNGNILIGNGGTGAVKEFTPSGVFVKDFVPAGSGGLLKPNAIVLRRVNY